MRAFLVGGLLLAAAPAGRAGVVVVANFTPDELTLTVTEPDRGKQTVTLAPARVAPITVSGPAVLVVPAAPQHLAFHIDPYNAYVILPDPATGRRLEGVELPGDPPERDARPEPNPAPRAAVKLPVTVYLDETDPRDHAAWQAMLRPRFAEASAVFEANCGITFDPVGFDRWRPDPKASTVPELLADLQDKTKAPPGGLAVGFTSRKVDEKPKEPAPFGASRAAPAAHVLVREGVPRAEPERVEVLVHHLGRALGAVPVGDRGSVMRDHLGDGLALHERYKMRFDPLNALALNVWADERRGGKIEAAADVSPAGRVRLKRVYAALLKAKPGDPAALAYLNEFDRDLAQAPPKKDVPPEPKRNPDPPKAESPRDVVARVVLAELTAKARAAGRASGDDLTTAYVRTAAAAALAAEVEKATPDDRIGGFLLGLAVALDDADALRADDATRDAVLAVEPPAARDDRREAMGNPTVRGRRDLCRRFAAGIGAGELLPRPAAEAAAVARTVAALEARRPAGVGLPALAAELAGIEFARQPRDDLAGLSQLAASGAAASLVPDVAGLPDALSPERFAARYGTPADARFQAALDDLRRRVRPPAKP